MLTILTEAFNGRIVLVFKIREGIRARSIGIVRDIKERVRGIVMDMTEIAEVMLGVGNMIIEGNIKLRITGVRKGITRNITGVDEVAVRIAITITGIVRDTVGIIKTEIGIKGSIRKETIRDMIDGTEMIVIVIDVIEVGTKRVIETQEMISKVRVQIVHETDLYVI